MEFHAIEIVFRLIPPARVFLDDGVVVGSRETSWNGPVPIECRVAKFSSLPPGAGGSVALFASHDAFDMIMKLDCSCGKIGSGLLVSISTVRSSITRASLTTESGARSMEFFD